MDPANLLFMKSAYTDLSHIFINLANPICKQMQLVIYCNQDKNNHQMLDADICINQDQRPRFPDEFIKELNI